MSINADSYGAIELTPSLRRGIEMLSVAYGYAREVHRDDWEFALEIQCLAAAGVNNSELRWLVCMGLALHAEEKIDHGQSGRVFHAVGDVTFTDRSCFVLTDRGYETFQQHSNRRNSSPSHTGVLPYRPSRHRNQ